MPDHIVDSGVQADVLNFTEEKPEEACVNWETCGNEVPGNGLMCGDCLDRVRRADRYYD